HVARQALAILRSLARRWKMDVDIKTDEAVGGAAGPEQGTRPVTTSLNFFATNFAEADFHPCSRRRSRRRGSSSSKRRGTVRAAGKRRRSDDLEGGEEAEEESDEVSLTAPVE